EAPNSPSVAWTTTQTPPRPQDLAYWPLWVNITAPLLGTLVFALVQALLLYIDDPGLRRAKRHKILSGPGGAGHLEADGTAAGADSGAVDIEKATGAAATPANGQAAAAAAAAAAMTVSTMSDAGVQCELIKAPADHGQQPQHPGANRRRTSSAGSASESDTMRLLEGMLLRPRRPLIRRRMSESEHENAIETGVGAAAVGAPSSSSALPGVSATQSLTGPGAKRFAAGLQQRLLAAKRSQQQDRRGSTSEA
ncbi:hypothetical protein BOX15_Mlig009747g2, partial [Macrostomum lignano]